MLDIAKFNKALKTVFLKGQVQKLTYTDKWLLANMKKNTEAGVKNTFALIYGTSQSGSTQFARSQANRRGSNVEAFEVTLADEFDSIEIDHKTIAVSKKDPQAFLSARVHETEMLLESTARRINISLYGDGSGVRGQILDGSTISGTVITLADPADSVYFEKGQVLNFVSARVGGSVRQQGGDNARREILNIDRDNGLLTVDAAMNTITGLTDTDFLVPDGDYGTAAKGILAWIAGSSVTSAPFHGVDRTSDKRRLAGQRLAVGSMSIDEVLVAGLMKCAMEGGKNLKAVVSFDKYTALANILSDKVQYVNTVQAGVGFEGIKIASPRGSMEVYADIDCPNAYGFILDMSTWELLSAGDCPFLFDEDGNIAHRLESKNAIEIRCQAYYNPACKAPNRNLVIEF